MLDEKSLRSAGFDEETSHPVTLADGQAWFLPKPHVRMGPIRRQPVFKAGKAERSRLVTSDPEFEVLSKAVEESDTYVSIANMAAYLLSRNYSLTDEQLGELLTYDSADESPDRWPLRVLEVAYGQTGPKA